MNPPSGGASKPHLRVVLADIPACAGDKRGKQKETDYGEPEGIFL
jgi:hypothetical protein